MTVGTAFVLDCGALSTIGTAPVFVTRPSLIVKFASLPDASFCTMMVGMKEPPAEIYCDAML